MNNKERLETVWNRDEKITEMMLESINDANTMKVKGAYDVALGLYDNAWSIIYQQMNNLYKELDDDDQEKYIMEDYDLKYNQLYKEIMENLTPEKAQSLQRQQQINAQRQINLGFKLSDLGRLIWDGMNFAGLFLKTKKALVPKRAIEEAE